MTKVTLIRPGARKATCPDWLDGEARKEWKRIAPALHRMARLEPLFSGPLSIYCSDFAFWMRIRRELAELKSTRRISGQRLNSQEFVKWCGILERLARQWYRDAKKMAREFGFPMTEQGMDLTHPLRLTRRSGRRGKK